MYNPVRLRDGKRVARTARVTRDRGWRNLAVVAGVVLVLCCCPCFGWLLEITGTV